MNKIGISNESSLHSFLKYRYTGKNGSTETEISGFICDGQTDSGEIIEVQTGSFGPLKKKIVSLCVENRTRLVHPIVINKYIELYDTGGKLLHRRKSPRRGSAWDLFKSLLYAPELPLLPNLTIELAVIDLVEKRIADGTGSWRRRGARIADKCIDTWHKSIVLKELKDYFQFIPFEKSETFTVQTLGEKAGIDSVLARKCLYVLNKLCLVERSGKEKNAYVYVIRNTLKEKSTKRTLASGKRSAKK